VSDEGEMARAEVLPQGTREVNAAIRRALRGSPEVTYGPVHGQDCLAVGLDAGATVTVEGSAGDYFAALNQGATVRLLGRAGRFTADTMTAGRVVIEESSGAGLGFSLYGGTVLVKGHAGGRVGQLNKGGTIVVAGNVGDLTGLYMMGGRTVIFGNAGEKTGDWMVGGAIFVAGQVASLGHNVRVVEPTDEDLNDLETLFETLDISPPPGPFKKLVREKLRPFYRPRKKGRDGQ